MLMRKMSSGKSSSAIKRSTELSFIGLELAPNDDGKERRRLFYDVRREMDTNILLHLNRHFHSLFFYYS